MQQRQITAIELANMDDEEIYDTKVMQGGRWWYVTTVVRRGDNLNINDFEYKHNDIVTIMQP